MITVDYKSTGTLLSEYIVTNLKIKYIGVKPDFIRRLADLRTALLHRDIDLTNIDTSERFSLIKKEFNELEKVHEEIWLAVEDTVKLRNADDFETVKQSGYAALKVFELNVVRVNLTRVMDEKLGENSVSYLEKSY
jgi:hypothetical protein